MSGQLFIWFCPSLGTDRLPSVSLPPTFGRPGKTRVKENWTNKPHCAELPFSFSVRLPIVSENRKMFVDLGYRADSLKMMLRKWSKGNVQKGNVQEAISLKESF